MKKTLDIKKLILLNMPYILMGLFATNFGEAWRMAQGADASEKFLSLVAVLPGALQSFWPSLHPLDLLVGLCCGGSLRLAVYLKSKNAKKYRHGLEYGSARWGTREDIAPYVDPVFQNNVILTKTESLTMNSRPKDPKTARNKNVLVIGGSGSGKTRFWLKPNLMQMHSSYVVTDPKGTILVECGKMLQRGAPKLGKDGKPMKDKHGKVIYEPYRIKVLNTINFKKSMHYNPFAYIHSEKDILKLVTTLIANTKGERYHLRHRKCFFVSRCNDLHLTCLSVNGNLRKSIRIPNQSNFILCIFFNTICCLSVLLCDILAIKYPHRNCPCVVLHIWIRISHISKPKRVNIANIPLRDFLLDLLHHLFH